MAPIRKLTQKTHNPRRDHRDRSDRRTPDLPESHNTTTNRENVVGERRQKITPDVITILDRDDGRWSWKLTKNISKPNSSIRRRRKRRSPRRDLTDAEQKYLADIVLNTDYLRDRRSQASSGPPTLSSPFDTVENIEAQRNADALANLELGSMVVVDSYTDYTNFAETAENVAILNEAREVQQSLERMEDNNASETCTNLEVGPETNGNNFEEEFPKSVEDLVVNSKLCPENQSFLGDSDSNGKDEALAYEKLENALASLTNFTTQLMYLEETEVIADVVNGEGNSEVQDGSSPEADAGNTPTTPSTNPESTPNVSENLEFSELAAFQRFADEMPIEREVQLVNQFLLHADSGEELTELQVDDLMQELEGFEFVPGENYQGTGTDPLINFNIGEFVHNDPIDVEVLLNSALVRSFNFW